MRDRVRSCSYRCRNWLALAAAAVGIAPVMLTGMVIVSPGPLVHDVAAVRTADGSIAFAGAADLPAGTKIMIELLSSKGHVNGQTSCTVDPHGRFLTEGFSDGGRAWSPGSYTILVTAYFTNLWQSDGVLATVGVNGTKLRSSALVPDDPDFPKAGGHLQLRIAVSFPPLSASTVAIEAVQRSRLLVVGSGRSSASVKETVDWFAKAPGFRPVAWSAVQSPGDNWVVTLACVDGGQRKTAQWSFDPRTRMVKYLDPLSKLLSYLPPN